MNDKKTMTNARRTSKFLSLVLRHRPDAIGLEIDPHGWSDIDDLLAKANAQAGNSFTRADIEHAVTTNDKQRFAISDDGRRIRANQGHSVHVDLGLLPIEPPSVLYHGTATRSLGSIRETGLTKQKRQHVHLSAIRETAVTVGERHGKPVVVEIDARQMHGAGHEFFRSANGVWLTESVPVQFLTVAAWPL